MTLHTVSCDPILLALSQSFKGQITELRTAFFHKGRKMKNH